MGHKPPASVTPVWCQWHCPGLCPTTDIKELSLCQPNSYSTPSCLRNPPIFSASMFTHICLQSPPHDTKISLVLLFQMFPPLYSSIEIVSLLHRVVSHWLSLCGFRKEVGMYVCPWSSFFSGKFAGLFSHFAFSFLPTLTWWYAYITLHFVVL